MRIAQVSIPNGDRHYLEQLTNLKFLSLGSVSIPNGDRHDLELYHRVDRLLMRGEFQSPMGIGITSNDCHRVSGPSRSVVSIPNGDRHYLELVRNESGEIIRMFQSPMGIGITSNSCSRACLGSLERFQSPMGIGITSNRIWHEFASIICRCFNPQWG